MPSKRVMMFSISCENLHTVGLTTFLKMTSAHTPLMLHIIIVIWWRTTLTHSLNKKKIRWFSVIFSRFIDQRKHQVIFSRIFQHFGYDFADSKPRNSWTSINWYFKALRNNCRHKCMNSTGKVPYDLVSYSRCHVSD